MRPCMKRFLLFTSLIALSSPAYATMSNDDPEILVRDGTFFGEFRYRYEYVDQDGPLPITEDARASTMRTNFGYKTGVYKDFQALGELQIVHNIGTDRFNDTVNGQTQFPVVADPNVAEINRFWLSYSGLPQTHITVGRQALNIDNQRFIGTVGWRQNDQTFDALKVTNSSIDNLNLMYSHVRNVNRIFGDDNTLGDLDSEVHIANAKYSFADWLNITGYGYWFDFDRLQARSSKTYGARLTGKAPIDDNWSFFYEAEAATQSEHENNPVVYDEEYYHIAPGIKGHGFTFKLGYEELGGDGTSAFQTPLATLHKFNGWADKFLNTPANGLEDYYTLASYQFSGIHDLIDGTKVTAVYHEFDGEESGDFGSELDLSVSKGFKLSEEGFPFKNINFTVKYADYDAEDLPYTDTQKIWFQVGVKF